jgi:hypothetical protein
LRGCTWAPEALAIPEEPLELSEKQIARNAKLAQWEDDSNAIWEKKNAKTRKKAHKIGRWDRCKLNYMKGLREHLRKKASALDYRIGHLPVAWFAEDVSPDSVNAIKDDPTNTTKDTTEDTTENTTQNAAKDTAKDTAKVTTKVTFKDPPKATFKNITTEKHLYRQACKARKNAPKDIPAPEDVPKDEPNDDIPENVEFPFFFLVEWYQKHEVEAEVKLEEYRQNSAKAKAEKKRVEDEKKKVDPNSLENIIEVPADWFEKPDRTYFPLGWFQNCNDNIYER